MDLKTIDKIYGHCGFTTTWVGDKAEEKKPTRNVNRSKDVDFFENRYKNLHNQYDEAFDKILKDNDFDPDEKTATFKFAGVQPVKVRILPERVRNERHSIHNKARKIYFDSFVESKRNQIKMDNLPQAEKDKRDLPVLFADIPLEDNKVLQGFEVAKLLGNPAYKPEQKNDIFRRYIEEMMENIEKYTQPCSDEEFLKNFSKTDALCHAMMLSNQTIKYAFKALSGCELEEKLNNRYDAYCAYAQQLYRGVEGRIGRMTDPSYEYFSDRDINKLVIASYNRSEVADINEDGMDIDPLASIFSSIQEPGYGKIPLESLKALNHISLYDVFCGKNGPVNDEDANKILQSGELIGVRSREGVLKAVGYDKEYRAFSININPNFDKKGSCKDLLGILNKGTRWYNKSSPEYSKMREDLGKLVKGGGDDLKLIASIKESADKYLQNHQYKDKISDIAEIRKNCVEEMLDGLKIVEAQLTVGANLKEHENALNDASIEKANQIRKEVDFKKKGGGIINDPNSDKLYLNDQIKDDLLDFQKDMGGMQN